MHGQKFRHGRVVSTPGALEAFERARESPQGYLQRHLLGDWGELDDEDKRSNDQAIVHNTRILSAYSLSDGTKVWIVTEWDRSVTTILLTSEY